MPPRVAFCSPVWVRGPEITLGWSDYWRLAIPAVALARNGWDVVLGRGLAAGTGDRIAVQDSSGHWHDDREAIVLHRWMSHHSADIIARAVAAGQAIVNDLDDHFWAFPPGHPGVWLTDRARDRDYNRDNYRAGLRASSIITTSTPALADVVASWGPRVRTVRNRVDPRVWPPREPGGYVGWIGSTAGRAEDLEALREGVIPWLRERGLPLYHGGARPEEPRIQDVLGYDNVRVRSAQSVSRYPRLWDPLRIALCPLGDTEFARCKSWVKPLEACARGVPFIASDHPEYRELGVGRLASTPSAWREHLDALDDPATYGGDVSRGLDRARELSIDAGWPAWASAIEDAIPIPSKESHTNVAAA